MANTEDMEGAGRKPADAGDMPAPATAEVAQPQAAAAAEQPEIGALEAAVIRKSPGKPAGTKASAAKAALAAAEPVTTEPAAAEPIADKAGAAKAAAGKVEPPKLDWIKPLMAEDPPLPPPAAKPAIAAAAAAAQEAPAPRKRFAMLAASVALAAALGAMGGALGASGLVRLGPAPSEAAPAPAPVVAAPVVPSEETRALKTAIAQLRSDVAALKSSLDAGARSTGGQIAKMTERFDKIERAQAEPVAKIAKVMDALDRIERQTADKRETTGSVAAPQRQAAVPAPAQPPIVRGWRVREVYRDSVAVLQGPRFGLLEVEAGDTVPGVGRVEAVRWQDGRWIVITSRGIIPPAR